MNVYGSYDIIDSQNEGGGKPQQSGEWHFMKRASYKSECEHLTFCQTIKTHKMKMFFLSLFPLSSLLSLVKVTHFPPAMHTSFFTFSLILGQFSPPFHKSWIHSWAHQVCICISRCDYVPAGVPTSCSFKWRGLLFSQWEAISLITLSATSG